MEEHRHPAELRRQIARAFNDSELRDLCFDLEIDYDDLPGEGKSARVRELLRFCMDHARLADLLAYCREQRPSIAWPDAGQVDRRDLTDSTRPASGGLLIARVGAQLAQERADALGGAARLDLGLSARPDLTLRAGPRPERSAAPRPLPPGRSIGQVFDDAGDLLLILGAPGSGKSTLLGQLAEELLGRARRDPGLPVPVVLNLSSWAGTSLGDWLPAAIYERYRVPPPLAAELLRDNRLALLLDGLDEVGAARRDGCVATISAFMRERLVPLVLCCRTAEYEQLAARAELLAAVELQPLADSQVRAALDAGGAPLAALGASWAADAELRELLRVPLLLNVAILSFADGAVERSGQPWGRRLLPAFVVRALRRRGDERRYGHPQALRWLRWLAQTLEAQGRAELYLERMQPAWMDESLHRPFDRWAGLARGIIIGGAVGGIVAMALPLLGSIALPSLARATPALSWLTLMLAVVVSFVVLMSVVALRAARSGSVERISPIDTLTIDPATHRRAWAVGVATAGIAATLFSFVRGPVYALVSGSSLGALLGMLMVARTMGWEETEDALREQPNQGIAASLRNAALVSLGVAISGTIGAGALFDLIVGPPLGPLLGLPLGIGASLFMWSFFGGETYSKHMLLRAMLARAGHAPLRYIPFLSYAVALLLLRRVGGGYAFQHRLLRDYLGALSDAEIVDLAADARR